MREVIYTSEQNTTLFMPASDTHTITGLKVVTLPGKGGAPKGAINIFAPEGELEGVLNAELITAFRTALAAMLPFVWHGLREGRESEVLVFGAGKQAEWHVRLVLLLVGERVRRVTVVNRGRKSLDKLRGELGEVAKAYPDVELVYRSREDADFGDEQLRDVVSAADAMFCCTPTTVPLFTRDYLQGTKRRFISCIGSYKPHMQEIDSTTLLLGGKILVDSKEACLKEAGELIMAGVQEEQLLEIGELDIQGSLEGNTPGTEGNTVFKCVGMGIMDLVVGRELLNIAAEKGVGVKIDEF